MRKGVIACVVGLVCSFILSSCVSRSPAAWSNPEFAERKIGKTVIMVIGESAFGVYRTESEFVGALAGHGVEAQSIHASYPSLDDMEKEQVVELVQSNRFDTIIVLRAFTGEEQQQVVATGYTSTPHMGYAGHGYWGYGMSYTLNPSFARVSKSTEYGIETNVFDVQSQKLVWSGLTRVSDTRSETKNIRKVVTNVVRDLKALKML